MIRKLSMIFAILAMTFGCMPTVKQEPTLNSNLFSESYNQLELKRENVIDISKISGELGLFVEAFWIQDDVIAILKYDKEGVVTPSLANRRLLYLINVQSGEIAKPNDSDAKQIEALTKRTLDMSTDSTAESKLSNVISILGGGGPRYDYFKGDIKPFGMESTANFNVKCNSSAGSHGCGLSKYDSNVYRFNSDGDNINMCYFDEYYYISGAFDSESLYFDTWYSIILKYNIKVSPDLSLLLARTCLIDIKNKKSDILVKKLKVLSTAPNFDWSKIAFLLKDKIIIVPVKNLEVNNITLYKDR